MQTLIQKSKLIGTGKYGRIFYTYSTDYMSEIAIKQVYFKSEDKNIEKRLTNVVKRELESWSSISKSTPCKHNIKLIDYIEEDEYAYFLMNYYSNGSIEKQDIENLDYLEKIKLIKHIAKGIKELHDIDICHGDVKIFNVLMDDNKNYRLCDYNNSDLCKSSVSGLYSIRGTLAYMAPEIFSREYGKAIDIWALGVISYYLLSGGRYPFEITNKTYNEVVQDILYSSIDYTICTLQMEKDFIQQCLIREKDRRFTIDEIIDHPFLKL